LVFLSLWIAAELALDVVPHDHYGLHGAPAGINGKYLIYDPLLGYTAAPNAVARHTEFWRNEKVYSVTYVIDKLGRRDTPIDSTKGRSKFLMFFGDSNTFGDGLDQKQTLPYWAGKLAPGYQPYNYALSGWGPTQMLDLLRTRNLAAEVPQKEGYAFFFFIDAHIARVIGSSQISAQYGSHFSYYALDGNGKLVRKGDFVRGRPFTTLFYDLVESSKIARHFGLVLPINYSEQDYRLVPEIMKQSEKILEKEFKLQGFYVVISPPFGERGLARYRRFMNELSKVGVKYLDFTRLYNTDDLRYRESEHDYHNSSLADRLIAAAILKDLGIRGAAEHQETGSTATGAANPAEMVKRASRQ
jgi:hypothetical protein